MMKLLLIIAATWVPALSEKKSSKSDLSNGFRTEIDWVEWDKAVGVAKDLNKPIFLLIHKTWCGACKGLKREFTTSSKMPELIELSEKFVMVNVEDDEEPEDDKYAPDGGYIPRILFLDTDAEPLKTNNGAKYKNNKYFYPLVPQVLDGMQRALDEFEAKSGSSKGAAKSDSSDASDEEEEKITAEKTTKKQDKKEKSEKKEDKKEKKSDKKEEKKEKKTEKKDDKSKKVEVDKKEKQTDKKEEKKEKKSDKKDDKKEKKTDSKEDKKEKKAEKKEKSTDDSRDKEEAKSKGKDGKKKEESKKDGKKKVLLTAMCPKDDKGEF